MSSILDLDIFVRTADSGSFSAAARALELTPAAASIAIKRLETRLGVRLLVRSTRSLRLTDEGRRYLDSVRLALGALAEGEQALQAHTLGLSGSLQLAAAAGIKGHTGGNHHPPHLPQFRVGRRILHMGNHRRIHRHLGGLFHRGIKLGRIGRIEGNSGGDHGLPQVQQLRVGVRVSAVIGNSRRRSGRRQKGHVHRCP